MRWLGTVCCRRLLNFLQRGRRVGGNTLVADFLANATPTPVGATEHTLSALLATSTARRMPATIAVRGSVLSLEENEPLTDRRLLKARSTYRSHLLFLPRQWRHARDTRFIGVAELGSAILELDQHPKAAACR